MRRSKRGWAVVRCFQRRVMRGVLAYCIVTVTCVAKFDAGSCHVPTRLLESRVFTALTRSVICHLNDHVIRPSLPTTYLHIESSSGDLLTRPIVEDARWSVASSASGPQYAMNVPHTRAASYTCDAAGMGPNDAQQLNARVGDKACVGRIYNNLNR
jgi:hypothetical protein